MEASLTKNDPNAESYMPDDDDDDDDNEDSQLPFSHDQRRRVAHTQAEQRRRDSIKKGYTTLQDLVPSCQPSDSTGYKLSKATVLQKSIDYTQYLVKQKKRYKEERDALRKEVKALEIMKKNYEHIVKAQLAPSARSEARISDDVKFQVFKCIVDELFVTFSNVSVSSFNDLSACVFNWVEEHCKPKTLHKMIVNVLSRTKNGYSG